VVLMLALQLLALHVHRVLVSLPRRAIAPLLLVPPVCVCVCEREREREREKEREKERLVHLEPVARQ
jgi:hypothetical protein